MGGDGDLVSEALWEARRALLASPMGRLTPLLVLVLAFLAVLLVSVFTDSIDVMFVAGYTRQVTHARTRIFEFMKSSFPPFAD